MSDLATFECDYQLNSWDVLGNIYNCYITKGTKISSLDESFVESAIGTHKSGHKNDDIKGVYITVGTIPYFPRGWEKIFKNLLGIHFCGTQLKEVHQSDLKPFPQLRVLYFHNNLIEIIEEGLFEYNPELEFIYLDKNKISHIDPKVFDNLSKLSSLYLSSNICINSNAISSSSQVQSIIAASKTQCTNSDYTNLDQKFKILEQDSKSLDSTSLNKKIENLEKDLKNSKYPNFFQTKLQNLKILQKSIPETTTVTPNVETCSSLKSKFINFSTNLKSWMDEVSNATGNDTQACDFAEVKNSAEYCLMSNESFSQGFSDFHETAGKIQDSYSKQKEVVLKIDEQVMIIEEKISKFNENLMSIKETVSNFNAKQQDLEETLIDKIELEVKAAHVSIIRSTNKAIEKIEKKMNIIMEKLDKMMNAKKTDKDYENFA